MDINFTPITSGKETSKGHPVLFWSLLPDGVHGCYSAAGRLYLYGKSDYPTLATTPKGDLSEMIAKAVAEAVAKLAKPE